MSDQSNIDNKSKPINPRNIIIACIILATVIWIWMIYGFHNYEKMGCQLSLNAEYNRYTDLDYRYQSLTQKYNKLVHQSSQENSNQQFIQQSLDELYDAMDQFQITLGSHTLPVDIYTEDSLNDSACIDFKEDLMVNKQGDYPTLPEPYDNLYLD